MLEKSLIHFVLIRNRPVLCRCIWWSASLISWLNSGFASCVRADSDFFLVISLLCRGIDFSSVNLPLKMLIARKRATFSLIMLSRCRVKQINTAYVERLPSKLSIFFHSETCSRLFLYLLSENVFFPVNSLSLVREVAFLELLHDLRSENLKLGKQTI